MLPAAVSVKVAPPPPGTPPGTPARIPLTAASSEMVPPAVTASAPVPSVMSARSSAPALVSAKALVPATLPPTLPAKALLSVRVTLPPVESNVARFGVVMIPLCVMLPPAVTTRVPPPVMAEAPMLMALAVWRATSPTAVKATDGSALLGLLTLIDAPAVNVAAPLTFTVPSRSMLPAVAVRLSGPPPVVRTDEVSEDVISPCAAVTLSPPALPKVDVPSKWTESQATSLARLMMNGVEYALPPLSAKTTDSLDCGAPSLMVILVRPAEVMVPTLPALVKPVADVGVNAVEVMTWYVPGVEVAVNVNVSPGSSVNCKLPAGFATVAGARRLSSCSTCNDQDRQRCCASCACSCPWRDL